MAEIVENELRAHLTLLLSYIQDNPDLLNKLQKKQQLLSEITILFYLDVIALYPRVPRQKARAAVEAALLQWDHPSIPTYDVLAMMDTVLDNNTITFNGIHYIQTEGTAIGSHLGMNYASIYMGSWEKELFRRSSCHSIAYLRFVDDVWGLWAHGAEALEEFFNVGNQIHPRI